MKSYRSLVLNPSASPLKDNKNGDYFKVNIPLTSCINTIYFIIKVFNYLYAGFKNVSLEHAETPEAKLLLQYILSFYINTKILTLTQLIHGAGPVWYKEVSNHKILNFNFRESHIIGATVFISSMIDAGFDLPDEHKDSPTSSSTPQWNKSLDKSALPKTNNPTDRMT